MIKGVDGGTTAPIPQDPAINKQEPAKSSDSVQPQKQDSAEIIKGAQSQATERASESSITSRLLATQLQSQIVPEKPVAVVGSAASEKPLMFKDGPNKPAEVKDMQHQVNEFRARNGIEPPLKEDGIFGPKTKAAVEQFQEANGLKKDGIIGPNTRDRLALENNENFQKLNPDSQQDIRDKMNGAQKDAVTRQNLLLIGTDEGFGKLPAAEQKAKLQDVNGTASDIAQKKLQGMNNEQLLKLAESPGGKEQLAALKISLQSGPQTPGTLKELDRINSATFTPTGGIKFSAASKPEDKAAYLHMVRRDMLQSPSFAKMMNELDADKAHPVTVNVGRNMPNVRLDADRAHGNQDIDLNDLDKLPEKPASGDPHVITQGEVLAHAMREAKGRTADPGRTLSDDEEKKAHDAAHAKAVDQENEFRKDLGQTTFRKKPPDDETVVDERKVVDPATGQKKDITLIIHFDPPAKDQHLVFDNQQKLAKIEFKDPQPVP